jgi:hypothetical protein
MPTNRKKRSRNSFNELDGDQLAYLVNGFCLDNSFHPYMKHHGDNGFPFRDEAHVEELRRKHEKLLSYIKQNKVHVSMLGDVAPEVLARFKR